MNRIDNCDRIRLDVILYAIYVALIPFDQVLNIAGSGTITKYLAMVVIVAMWVFMLARGFRVLSIERSILPFVCLGVWLCITMIWGITGAGFPITFLSLLALFLTCYFRKFNDRELKFILIIMFCSALFMSEQLITNPSMRSGARATYVLASSGVEADPNTIGLNLALSAIIGIYVFIKERKVLRKIIVLGLSIIILLGIVMTGSRTAFIAFFVGVCILLFGARQQLHAGVFKVAMTIMCLIIIFEILLSLNIVNISVLERLSFGSEDYISGNGRIEIWKDYLTALLKEPFRVLLGYGSGSTHAAYDAIVGIKKSTHNSYIYYLVTAGIVGLILMLKIISGSMKLAKKNGSYLFRALLVACAVGCIFIDFFEKKPMWNILVLIWAYQSGKATEENTNDF